MHAHGGSCVFTVHVFLHGHVSSHVIRCFFMFMVVHVFHGHGHGHGGLSFPRSWSWWFVFSCSWWFMCSIVMHGGSWFSWAWFHVVHGHGFMLSMVIVMAVFVFIFMVVHFFIVMHGVSCFPWSCMCMVSCCSWS